ncbi:hypothetical protein QUF64_03930 [Anaerolineales bacterium HSG6]|nr:hypothetical protein [Anaerolineales bacterium HSG6]
MTINQEALLQEIADLKIERDSIEKRRLQTERKYSVNSPEGASETRFLKEIGFLGRFY